MANDAHVATLDGRLDDAIAIGRQIAALGEELGFSTWADMIELVGAQTALTYFGRFDELTRLWDLLMKWPLSPLLLAYLHRDTEAVAALDELLASRSGLEPSEDETWGSEDVHSLQAAILVGHREAGEFLVRRFAHKGLHMASNLGDLTCLSRHLGAAAAFLGRPEEARAYYEEAMDMATRLRFRPEIALTRLQLAELLLAHYPDEKAEALEHLDFAIGEFREMKMQPALERALKQRETLKA